MNLTRLLDPTMWVPSTLPAEMTLRTEAGDAFADLAAGKKIVLLPADIPRLNKSILRRMAFCATRHRPQRQLRGQIELKVGASDAETSAAVHELMDWLGLTDELKQHPDVAKLEAYLTDVTRRFLDAHTAGDGIARLYFLAGKQNDGPNDTLEKTFHRDTDGNRPYTRALLLPLYGPGTEFIATEDAGENTNVLNTLLGLSIPQFDNANPDRVMRLNIGAISLHRWGNDCVVHRAPQGNNWRINFSILFH